MKRRIPKGWRSFFAGASYITVVVVLYIPLLIGLFLQYNFYFFFNLNKRALGEYTLHGLNESIKDNYFGMFRPRNKQ